MKRYGEWKKEKGIIQKKTRSDVKEVEDRRKLKLKMSKE